MSRIRLGHVAVDCRDEVGRLLVETESTACEEVTILRDVFIVVRLCRLNRQLTAGNAE